MFGCEVFKEFYAGNTHAASTRYLFFGLHGHNALVPWIWGALGIELIAAIILITPLGKRIAWLNLACVFAFMGIWVEKGPGMVIPGFLPTPLGEIVEYFPTGNEFLITVGIWSFGFLLFSWMLRLALPIMSGEFHHNKVKDGS